MLHKEPIHRGSTRAPILKGIGYFVLAGALLSFYGAVFLIKPY
jgi:type IV secretory pathway VirB3-like protein